MGGRATWVEAGAVPSAADEGAKAIAERLGHASITTTLNQYGHLFPALDEQPAARLDDLGRPFVGRDGNGMEAQASEQQAVGYTN